MANRTNRRSYNLFISIAIVVTFIALLAHTPTARANATDAEKSYKEKNYSQAFSLCNEPAVNGDGACQFWLGHLYKYGHGVNRDLSKAIFWLKKSAEQNIAAAQEALGDCYRNEIGVKKDYAEAFRLFKLAEKKGNLWAINQLGGMYRYGQFVDRDSKKSFELFEQAAKKGNPAAQANLADMYRLGAGVDKNPDAAFQWATKSSRQGWPTGQYLLGILFRDGVGVRQDSAQAIELIKLAANSRRLPAAYCSLANLYRSGGPDIQSNLIEALSFAEEGIKLEDPCSHSVAAVILARGGQGVSADAERAFELASKGSAANHAGSINVLGWLHRDGIGTVKNPQLAVELFQRAAMMNDRNAMANLARAYARGEGIEEDQTQARHFYQEALKGRLAPGNRNAAETFLAKATREDSPRGSITSETKTEKTSASVPATTRPAPGAPDPSQQTELLSKLEKMQQQLAALQASTNSANVVTAVGKPQLVYANRQALVVGNDAYKYVNPLENAGADAEAIAKSLESVGYRVTLHKNLNEKSFKQVLRDFRLQVQGGDEVLFYFAGHGVQVGSANFLLPVDIQGDSEDQVKDEAIELQRILDLLRERKAKFSLAIIDACRDNPFKQAGRAIGGRGLAPTTAATGQMVMFSAGAGEQALDRLGANDKEKNGLFTRVLLKEMIKPGVSVDRVLRNVRAEVVKLASSVGREQTPALYDQAVGDFYFKR